MKAQLTVGILIIIAEIFLLINAPGIFPEQGRQIQDVLIVYLVMQAVVLASFAQKMPGLNLTPDMLVLTAVGFLVTLFAVKILPETLFASFEPIPFQAFITAGILGFTVLYAVIKAFIEEAIFRGIFLKRVGLLWQAVIFGLFHFTMLSAFGASAAAVVFGAVVLTMLGYVWGIMAQRGTIMLSLGSHAAWNLAAVGFIGVII